MMLRRPALEQDRSRHAVRRDQAVLTQVCTPFRVQEREAVENLSAPLLHHLALNTLRLVYVPGDGETAVYSELERECALPSYRWSHSLLERA